MAGFRDKRLASFLRQEISQMLLEGEIKDPRLKGLITVTEVECSKDLRHAKIYISVLGASEHEGEKVVEVLNSAQGFIKSKLSPFLKIKWMPELLFKWDQSLESGARIYEKLRKISEETQTGNE